MASINLDRAYCYDTDSILTIYQVRELHFDESCDFLADKAKYECPDINCTVKVVGVNHTKTRYIRTPHFRLLPNHEHNENCGFYSEKSPTTSEANKNQKKQTAQVAVKFPEVLLLERQPIPTGTGKKDVIDTLSELASKPKSSKSSTNTNNKSKYETSSLEHVVETWISNSEEDLKYTALTIGQKTKWYRNIFKPIEYFTDEEGLIYWGYIKEIKQYGKGYVFKFEDWPWFEGEKRPVSIHIKSKQIDKYRKKNLFRSYINSLIDRENIKVRCFFVGTYPKPKKEAIKKGEKEFHPLEVEIKNLDHLVLRFEEDSEDI